MSKTPLLHFRRIGCRPARGWTPIRRGSLVRQQIVFPLAVVLCFASFGFPRPAMAADWSWAILVGSFDDSNNWNNTSSATPPHGEPQADSITAFNTAAGHVTIQCSGNTVANAILDCSLDHGSLVLGLRLRRLTRVSRRRGSSGSLNVTGILHDGEGSTGGIAAGTVLSGNGKVTAEMLRNELIVTGEARCNIGTAVYSDGTGDSHVFVTGPNTSFSDTGDFNGSLSVSNQATASISNTFAGDLSLAGGASVAVKNIVPNPAFPLCTVEIDSSSLNGTGSFAGQMTISNSGSAAITGPAQGSFYLSPGTTLKVNGELLGGVQAAAATLDAGSLSLSQLSLSNGSIGVVSGDASIDLGVGGTLLDGISSQLKVSGTLSLKNGIFSIQNGATVTSDSGSVGSDVSSGAAAVEVDSKGAFNVNGNCFVGDASVGNVWIHGGSSATFGGDLNHKVAVGNAPTGQGFVTVGDTGSALQIIAPSILGVSGLGEVTVTNGATVHSDVLELGATPGSSGTIGISGPGSAWVAKNDLFVGGLDTAQPGGYGFVGVAKGGTLRVGPNLYISASGAVGVTGGGQIAVGQGSFGASSTLSVTRGGKVYGKGMVRGQVVVNQGGIFAPGDSPGIFNIQGDYQQEAGGELDIVIGGNTAGTGFSQVRISGTATLSGTLKVILVNGYQPAAGQSFPIVVASGVSGSFSQVKGASISYGPRGITISNVTSVSTPATLSIRRQGQSVALAWPTTVRGVQGYSLQTTTNLALGIWSAVPTSSNAFLINPVNPAAFFRLIH